MLVEYSPELLIEVDCVSKSFGSNLAVDSVSFSVPRGQIFGLLGPNGAGKTTIVKILTTLLSPDSGRATVAGLDVVKEPQRLRSRIGLAGQYAAVDENLTGRENLDLVGRLYHLPKKLVRSRSAELLNDFDLTGAADRVAKGYSGGMRRRLDLAAALIAEPVVLFLDEPTTGLDPRSRNDLWEVLERLAAMGSTILLTTQYLEEADRLAQNLAVIDSGKVIAMGTPSELKSLVGSSVLEVALEDASRHDEAATVLSAIALDPNKVEIVAGRIRMAIRERSGIVADVVRLLDQSGLPVAEVAVMKPTLDDAFLSLVGHGTKGGSDD